MESSQQQPQLTYRAAVGIAWGKGTEPIHFQSQLVMGCRLLQEGGVSLQPGHSTRGLTIGGGPVAVLLAAW